MEQPIMKRYAAFVRAAGFQAGAHEKIHSVKKVLHLKFRLRAKSPDGILGKCRFVAKRNRPAHVSELVATPLLDDQSPRPRASTLRLGKRKAVSFALLP